MVLSVDVVFYILLEIKLKYVGPITGFLNLSLSSMF